MTDETEPRPPSPALPAEEDAEALADLLGEDTEPGEDRPLGVVKGRYQPVDRRRPAPPSPPAPPTPPPAG
ncbi:hypothetical protein [Streptomyces sp. NPDC001388]|uniref:hypothetical protein n=1 Tax=unclassified Streptomyces TaxID=2593676 RepID=UPI0036C8C008